MKKAIIPILVVLILCVWGGIAYLYVTPPKNNSGPTLPTLFSEYRAALTRKDMESLKLLVTKENQAPLLALITKGTQDLPPHVTVTDVSINGTNATLSLSSEVDGKAMASTAHYVKVDNAWLLNKEDDWVVDASGGEITPEVASDPGNEVVTTPNGTFDALTAGAGPFFNPDLPPECHAIISAHPSNDVTDMAFTPDGRFLVTVSYGDFSVKVWNTETWTETASMKSENRIRSIAMAADGQSFWTADAYKNILQWQLVNGELSAPTVFLSNAGDFVAVSPDGSRMAATAFQTTIGLWNLRDRSRVAMPPELMANTDQRVIKFLPNSTNFITAGAGNTFTVWSMDDTNWVKTIQTISKVSGEVTSLAATSDGFTLATGHNDSSIVIHDLLSSTERFNYFIQDASTMALAISPDDKVLVSANLQTLYLWDLTSSGQARPLQLGTLTGHSKTLRTMVFSPDGSTLASGDEGGDVRIWRAGPMPVAAPPEEDTSSVDSEPAVNEAPSPEPASPESTVEPEVAPDAVDEQNMQPGVTLYKPKAKPRPKASGSIAFRRRANWVLNPSADHGLTNWIPVGLVQVTSTDRDSNPFFGLRKEVTLQQDICLTGQPERVVLVIARAYSERFNPQGDVTGYPRIDGDWLNMAKLPAKQFGRMEAASLTFSPKQANQWGVLMGVFEIPKKATHLRLYMRQAVGLAERTESLAGFDDVSVYFFPTLEAARQQGGNFAKAAAAIPR